MVVRDIGYPMVAKSEIRSRAFAAADDVIFSLVERSIAHKKTPQAEAFYDIDFSLYTSVDGSGHAIIPKNDFDSWI